MEFHLPEPIRNLKDFFYHLGVVTLGILIALGLEQIVEAHHRAKIGRSSMESFRRELMDNRERVNEILATLPKSRTQIEAEIARVSELGDAAAKAPVPIAYPDLHLLLMSSAAWDTAIATQALYYIPAEEAQRFSRAYGAFAVFMNEEHTGVAAWQDLRRFGEDAGVLTPGQRRDFIEQLHRYESYTYVVEMIGQGTLQDCERALGTPAVAAAGSTS
jgi:hypothetical protein